VCAVVLSALGCFTGPTAAAPAMSPAPSVGIRLLDAPTEQRDDPRARIYIIDHVRAGGEIKRHVAITNTTSDTVAVRLYAGAASIADGRFVALESTDTNEVAGWTTASPSVVHVPPSSTRLATVTIAIPAEATAGERYGVVWAEPPPATAHGVKLVNRVGMRIYLSVGNGAEPSTDFRVRDLAGQRLEDGTARVTARVDNIGARAIDLVGWLKLHDRPHGLNAGPYEASPLTLAPGQSGTTSVQLGAGLLQGPWGAEMTMQSGEVTRTVSGELNFTGAPPATRSSNASGAVSSVLTVGLLAALITGVGLVDARRRKRANKRRSQPTRRPNILRT
jgi:hypothetical protein